VPHIFRVDKVSHSWNKKLPPTLNIVASGVTRSGGWTAPSLEPRIYVMPPQDGVQDFDFVAVKPTGPSTDQLAEIEASTVMEDLPSWFRGVRVHAETNHIERKINKGP
jgi:hypothetical protein